MATRSLARRVSALRADVVRGSSAIARDAAEILRDAALDMPSGDLTDALARLAIQILEAQPSMAPLVTLAREVLTALEPGSLDEVRWRAAGAARAFAERLAASQAAAARQAAELLPAEGAVLTLSASSSVEAALVHAARSRSSLEVVCLEGRPMYEGRALASALAGVGVRVTLAVDAAAESLMDGCAAVLLGADSIGDGGIVNKIGSAGLAHAAARREIPTFVVADSSKLLPAGFPQRVDHDRPSAEVWEEAGPVRVWNRYFEILHPDRLTRVILEDGAASAAALEGRRLRLSVPPRLRDWLAAHG